MKPSSSTGKLSSSSGNSKNKKSSKEREKRKSQSASETSSQHNSEKGSPTKDSSTRKYAGYGPDQLTIMAEQSIFEHLTDEVCVSFTEDLNYKLRYVIYDALAKARLSGRNYITSADIDDTFECLQIDKVYGAPAVPNWITFSDQNLHYLDDTKINLIELAEEANSFVQPNEPIVVRKWLPETKEVSKNLKQYFTLMCQAVVEKDQEVRFTALANISKNNLIGPIIEWFYHFGYFLLSKDITYDSLTLRAFDLIEALESNPTSSLIVSEKQIMLLTRLLLQRLLRSITTSEVLKPMCRILSILCIRVVPRKVILKKIISKFPEIKEDFAIPVMCVVNELGLDAIYSIVLPHLRSLLSMSEEQKDGELIFELLRCYNILCKQDCNLPPICDAFYESFGDGIVPIWKHPNFPVSDSPNLDYNWTNVKMELIKTRRKINPCENKNSKKLTIEEAFPEDVEIKTELFEYQFEDLIEKDYLETKKTGITFKFHNFTPMTGRARFLTLANNNNITKSAATSVVIGKRTLLIPVLNKFVNKSNEKCIDHSILYYNL